MSPAAQCELFNDSCDVANALADTVQADGLVRNGASSVKQFAVAADMKLG